MAERRDDEFTLEELRLARTIFTTLVVLSAVLLLAINVSIAVGGYIAWPWFLIIPAGALLIFAARVVRRYFRNILEGVLRDLAVQEEYQAPVRPANDLLADVLRLSRGSAAAAIAIMLFVSGFWYLVGAGIRWWLALS